VKILRETDTEIELGDGHRPSRKLEINQPLGFITVTDTTLGFFKKKNQFPLAEPDNPLQGAETVRGVVQISPNYKETGALVRGTERTVTYWYLSMSIGGGKKVELWRGNDPSVGKRIKERILEASHLNRENAGLVRMELEKDVQGLVNALKHPDYSVRAEAARILGLIGDKRAVEPLLQTLNDVNSGVRSYVAGTLIELKDVERLTKALRNPDHEVRSEIVRILGSIGDKRATVSLVQALEDINEAVQWIV